MKNKILKISGKTFSLSEDFNRDHQNWQFELRPGGWVIASLLNEKKEISVRKRIFLSESKDKISINLNGQTWFGEIQNNRIHHEGDSEIPNSDTIAQFPGKVRKVLVHDDDLVQAGDILILMEAMKMEFTIRSPFVGKVKKVFVQEGQQVSPGDVFLELEKGA